MLIHPKSQNSQDARELAIARGKVMELENPEANVVCINQVETPKNSGQFIVGIQRAPTTTELQNTPVGINNYWKLAEIYPYTTI